MKNLIYPMLLVIFISCGSDDSSLEVPKTTLTTENPNEIQPGVNSNEVLPEASPNTSTEPCKIDLLNKDLGLNLKDIGKKGISCIVDLKGNTVDLPANTILNFDKGDIINGTLNFTSGGQIDGRLLNLSLKIKGDTKLIDNKFIFFASRWSIVEGEKIKNDKKIALQNRKNINEAISTVKRLGGKVFEVNKIDAYFNVEANKVNRQYQQDRSIRIPSDFHFKMSNKTNLRVQPTKFPAYSLITTFVKDNVIISGGNLIGDRWDHDYSPIIDISGTNRDEHGFGNLIWVIGSHFVTIDGVNAKESIGEGIIVHSETIRNPNGTLKTGTRTSENVVIKKCIITACRRNNIAVIDAKGVVIDDCDILDTGKGEQAFDGAGNKIFSSSGTAPRYGIDLEALRFVNDDGTINEINKIDDVVIKNSRFKGNAAGDIDVYTVTNVIIENNFFDKWVANFAANDITIRNNTFVSRDPEITFGINIQSFIRNDIEFNYNYTITGNTITGYRDGVKLSGYNQKLSNNTIINCVTGLQIGSLADSEISENKYISNLPVSYGINPFPNSVVENVTILGDSINVTNRPINFRGLNNKSTKNTVQVTLDRCNFKSSKNFPLYLKDSKNISIKNSSLNTKIETINSVNIVEKSNTITN